MKMKKENLMGQISLLYLNKYNIKHINDKIFILPCQVPWCFSLTNKQNNKDIVSVVLGYIE